MEAKRVVVTGLGVISPIGNTVAEVWDSLMAGKNGICPITLVDTTEHTTKIAGEITDFNALDHIDRKEARKMDRFTQFAMVAAKQAVDSIGSDLTDLDKEQVAVIIASGIGGMQTFEDQIRTFVERGPRRVSPFFIPMMIPDIASGQVSIMYGFKGPNYCTVSACASASHAIGDAFHIIQSGKAVAAVSGGAEAPITNMGLAGFNALKALSTRNDDPATASRPFDADRDGFVMGEGSAVLFLEELEHAKARGAHIYCEIIGHAFSGDAYHMTAPVPDGNGATLSMLRAIKDAGIQPEDVDYVNAHGTSTSYNDKIETLAIKNAFGEHAKNLKISSTKSMCGHLLGASGAIEALAVALMLERGKLHPTINYSTPDPDCDLDYIPNKAIDYDTHIAISNSFGFGGHNATLVFKKYAE